MKHFRVSVAIICLLSPFIVLQSVHAYSVSDFDKGMLSHQHLLIKKIYRVSMTFVSSTANKTITGMSSVGGPGHHEIRADAETKPLIV